MHLLLTEIEAGSNVSVRRHLHCSSQCAVSEHTTHTFSMSQDVNGPIPELT